MKRQRTSGIILHPTSLPGRYGIGDLGPEADRFVDFLAGAKQGALAGPAPGADRLR